MEYVRLIERSFKGYTGMLGDIEFKEGVSCEALSRNQIDRIAAAMRVESVSGEQLGIAARLVASKGDKMDARVTTSRAEPAPAKPAEVEPEPAPEPVVETSGELPTYDRAVLEAIADQKGIVGLREIADQLDVKGRSVMDLIAGIMKAQAEND